MGSQTERVVLVVVGTVTGVFALATVVALWTSWFVIGIIFLSVTSIIGIGWVGLHGYEKLIDIRIKHQTIVVQVKEEPLKEIGQSRRDKIPSFMAMLRSGMVGPGRPFVLGWSKQGDSWEPRSIQQVKSTFIGGLQGTGKTVTTMFFMLSAIVRTGGKVRFVIVDPHMHGNTGEELATRVNPLRPFFLTLDDVRATVPPDDMQYIDTLNRAQGMSNPVVGGKEAVTWARIFKLELERRKRGKKGEPWLLVVDELSAVMRDKDVAGTLSDVLTSIQQEARKFELNALLIGQDLRAQALGGTDVRNAIPVQLMHRAKYQWANLILPASEAKMCERLDKGEVILADDTGQMEKIMISLVTEEDLWLVADMFAANRVKITEETNDYVDDNYSETGNMGNVLNGTQTQPLVLRSPPAPSPVGFDETARIKELFAKGHAEADIAKLVFGVKSGGELAEAKLKVRETIVWLIAQV